MGNTNHLSRVGAWGLESQRGAGEGVCGLKFINDSQNGPINMADNGPLQWSILLV